MKSLITLATILTLTSCNPKPKETDVVSRVDCETYLNFNSQRMILRYFKTEYKSGYVRASGSIQQPGSRYIVQKTYEPGSSMGSLGYVTVKTDSEFFVSFMVVDETVFGDKDGPYLAIEYLVFNGLTTFYAQKDECKETKGNK
jgi:hypothetical protein